MGMGKVVAAAGEGEGQVTTDRPATTPPVSITAPASSDTDCPCHDAERLRKLREGILRNATALAKAIDQVLAEIDKGQRAA